MRRGETSTDTFTIDELIYNPKAVQITYRQGNWIIVQKQLNDIDYEIIKNEEGEDSYTQLICTLSQEETFRFDSSEETYVQVRIITQGNVSLVSTIEKIKVQECLDCNILPLEE